VREAAKRIMPVALSVVPTNALTHPTQEVIVALRAGRRATSNRRDMFYCLRRTLMSSRLTRPYQGHGVGSAVIGRVIAEIQPYALGGLSMPRVSFYERLGWERWRGPTAMRVGDELVPTPDDTVMILRTPTTPPLDIATLLIADYRDGQAW